MRLGETPESELNEFIDFRVVRIELHPEAGWTEVKNNLAILFLERDIEFEEYSSE